MNPLCCAPQILERKELRLKGSPKIRTDATFNFCNGIPQQQTSCRCQTGHVRNMSGTDMSCYSITSSARAGGELLNLTRAPNVFCIPGSTRINPTFPFDENPKGFIGRLGQRSKPQYPSPFASQFVVHVRRDTINDNGKRLPFFQRNRCIQ